MNKQRVKIFRAKVSVGIERQINRWIEKFEDENPDNPPDPSDWKGDGRKTVFIENINMFESKESKFRWIAIMMYTVIWQ